MVLRKVREKYEHHVVGGREGKPRCSCSESGHGNFCIGSGNPRQYISITCTPLVQIFSAFVKFWEIFAVFVKFGLGFFVLVIFSVFFCVSQICIIFSAFFKYE
ncbi:hypothetical protein BGY98DRAFT_1192532 [Russula aff. rugulosa BPL654]|nr:hypothetical protein BGY98DRAFT_1192532 [Russula aff. rugulosa BPL654]